jgi:putative nucleotidyltransferase with HDIG domain/PAS domain S-box-containing protein
MNKLSPHENDRESLRAQIVGLGDQTLRKSYFPQLQKQIEELKKARAAEEEKSAALEIMIRDLRESRAQAEESERKFRTLADFTNDMEYWTGPDDRIIYMSPSCELLTGYSQSDFAAHPELFESMVHPDDRSLLAIHALGAALVEPHCVALRIITRQGLTRWFAHTCHSGQLESAFMHTVLVAMNLSELRDPYTAGHERRVGEIARAIANELGLDENRAKGVEVAGYLHDLGKMTIPAEILTRPGKLSAVELMLIRGHAQASYNVLQHAEFPWPVADIALQHHERLDGSGYPQGLKGEEILLEARILAVADVVEAMASHRPYRPPLGIDQALAEIERGCGTLYDPAVVEVCLRLFREKGFKLPQ